MLEQLAPGKEHIVLGKDLDATLRELVQHDAVVLASGDPGFFGIVRALSALAPIHVHPAPSSVALAFARLGVPWDDALVVSAHGRDPHAAINAALRHPKVAILTQPGNTELIVEALAHRRPVVLEALGTPDERLATEPPFNDPNVVIVHEPTAGRATVWPPRTPTRWALPEDAFEHRAGMITKAEVRALALAALGPGTGDHIWDVGCGSGAVGIECALLGAAVTAIDQDPDAIALATRNAAAHGVPLATVLGAAPESLQDLREPDAVFVGGGGPAVLDAAARARRAVVVTLALIDRVVTDDRAPLATVRGDRDNAAGQPGEAARGRAPPRRGEPRDRDRGPPMNLVAGVGCSLGCPPEELRALIEATLPAGELVALATVDRRAQEPCMLAAAEHFGVPLRTHAAEALAQVDVPTPSAVVARHVGTPSVAEAAALLSGTRLLVPKTRSEHATCAVAECPE